MSFVFLFPQHSEKYWMYFSSSLSYSVKLSESLLLIRHVDNALRTTSSEINKTLYQPSNQLQSNEETKEITPVHCHRYYAKSLQSCPTLCDPLDGSPPGSPVPGILQARTLEWIAISFSSAWKWKGKVKSLIMSDS